MDGAFSQELEELRRDQPGDLLDKDYPKSKTVKSSNSGYIQLILFKDLIKEAEKDNIVIKMEVRVGSFILNGNQLFTYWGPGANNVDESKYVQLIRIGRKETEIQDLKFGLNKLGEIAIKAMGNDDPKTASNTIFQVTDLLLTLEEKMTFSPYLVDENNQVRLILEVDNFEYHLYQGLGVIRHYAQKNYPIITDIIAALTRLAGAIDKKHHNVIWGFASNTIDHIYTEFIFEIDRQLLLRNLYKLAKITGNIENYHYIEQHFKVHAQ
ncbi:DUF2254 family protein [Oceanobacillus kimchii]|uniref:DUF2254 family protein n=1 Tax=Oceanobacillus kimchii TaxID=746691 RepID=UPI00233099B3|nr:MULTISPECIES: DUF2254 family protein [Oceanobacillus]